LAAQRAVARASAEAAARRRKLWYGVYGPIGIVVAVVLVLVLVRLGGNSTNGKPGNSAAPATNSVAEQVTTVPLSVLNQVGKGSATSPPTAMSGAALTSAGKPRILYVGAEWCPYCAAERWPLTVALSRFGTFTGLGETKSSPSDTYANTPTLTFVNATYTSQYLVFDGKEVQDGNHNNLATLDSADTQLFSSLGHNSFPFIDIGGKYLQANAQFDPGMLDSMTQDQIAAALHDPTTNVAQAVNGGANVLTAAICGITGGQPTDVCTASGVTAAAAALG
jgi:thiol-disulfide isomerase/thioredoxin